MGFFLVGRGRNAGDLTLLSELVFPERDEALAALSGLMTVDKQLFDGVDAFVVDLDAAMPVLFVPTAPTESVVEEASPEPLEEAIAEATPEPPEEAAFETAEEVELESVEEVERESVEEVERESAEQEEVVAAEEPEAAAPLDQLTDVSPGLAEALMRATGSLESEGIVAPESVVLEEPVDLGAEPPGAPEESVGLVAEPLGAHEEPFSEPTEELAVTLEDPLAAVGETAWPWGEAQAEETAEAAASAVPAVDDVSAQEVMPELEVVAEAAATEFVPDALEEPAPDVEGEILMTGVDDETFDLSQPLIMGDYRDEPITPVTPSEEPAAGEIAYEEATPPVEAEPLADLLAESPAYELADATAGPQTCDDCVYVETCPNKDGATPATCGSFQWRAI